MGNFAVHQCHKQHLHRQRTRSREEEKKHEK